MLTAEQVKAHSEVLIGSDMPSEDNHGAYAREYVRRYFKGEDWDFTKSRAKLLYLHNGCLNKLEIICQLIETIPSSEVKRWTEEDVKATIDWDKFAQFINKHDDLSEDNLLSVKEFSDYLTEHRDEKGVIGRNGALDLIQIYYSL